MSRNYWMINVTPENFAITRDLGFTVLGLQSIWRKKAQRMEPGDRLLFYIREKQTFGATANVTSTYCEEHTPVWKSHIPTEDFPYRVQTEPVVVLEEEEFLDARQIGPRLDYVKKWVPEMWPLAFLGELHLIPRKDFTLIEEEMKKAVSARAKAYASL